MFALHGLLTVIFDILAFIKPDLTLLDLVLLFGACAAFDTVFAVAADSLIYGESWWQFNSVESLKAALHSHNCTELLYKTGGIR